MLPRTFALLLLLATSAFAQTTATMCQTVPVTVLSTTPERRLVGCGVGFPDNLLWHLDRSDSVEGSLDQKAHKRLTGRGAVIYLLDSGVLQGHQEFQRSTGSNVIAGIDAVGTAPCNSVLAPCISGGIDYIIEGHGTATASIAVGRTAGVAPDAKLVAVYAVTSRDAQWENVLKKVIAHAFDPGSPQFQTAIVSMSFVPGFESSPLFDALMRKMITGVNAAGEADPNGKKFFFVVAGGNSGPLFNDRRGHCSLTNEPAVFPTTVAPQIDGLVSVGGLTKDNRQWEGGCQGAAIEVLAPAADMLIASPMGVDHYRGQADLLSGTSYAAPYVAGIAARMLEANPSLTPAQLEAQLKASPSRVDGKPVPVMLVEPWQRRRAVR